MKHKHTVRRDFDRAFFKRFYEDRSTTVISEDDVFKRACFVIAYLSHLQVPVHDVLDAGCGTGLWQRALAQIDTDIQYLGIDPSAYLCEKYGWFQSSVEDFRSRKKFDLVVCQDVMQYMNAGEVERSFDAIAAVCRGALYFDVPTTDDIEDDLLDMKKTDKSIHVRSAAWYRRRLAKHFENAGGGVFVAKDAGAVLLALERGR
ncbi:MAG TPA: methyltransferase domain-containing protein [Candidatus Krumholzibacteria bacterium]|nr:methyltransferase domain-containing protein [Candidatus Krumholzibacteria bacterium]